MDEHDQRRVVEGMIEAWRQAGLEDHWTAIRHLCHEDVVLEWPQTGERVDGIEDVIALHRAYPGGLPEGELLRVTSPEDQWVLDGMFRPRRVTGTGDVWFVEATARYPAGDVWAYAAVFELRDGRIARVTEYYAPHDEPPEWRARWVTRTR